VAPPIANFHVVRRTMLFDHPSIDGQNDARDPRGFFEARDRQHRLADAAAQRLPIGDLESPPSKTSTQTLFPPPLFALLCVTGHEASLFCSRLVGCRDELQFDLATPTHRRALGIRPRQLSQRPPGSRRVHPAQLAADGLHRGHR